MLDHPCIGLTDFLRKPRHERRLALAGRARHDTQSAFPGSGVLAHEPQELPDLLPAAPEPAQPALGECGHLLGFRLTRIPRRGARVLDELLPQRLRDRCRLTDVDRILVGLVPERRAPGLLRYTSLITKHTGPEILEDHPAKLIQVL